MWDLLVKLLKFLRPEWFLTYHIVEASPSLAHDIMAKRHQSFVQIHAYEGNKKTEVHGSFLKFHGNCFLKFLIAV